MKKNFFKIFTLIVTVFCFQSCEKLDLPSDGRLTLKDIFSEYQTTRNYFDRVVNYVPQVGFTYDNTPLASFSDEAQDASDGVSGRVNDWYNNRTSPTYNPLITGNNSWQQYFEGVRKCNVFLESINDPSISTAILDETEKNGWIGEVLTLRAFFYLQLIKRYGGVPLISAPYKVTHDFSTDGRASFEECVDFILSDCDAALAIPESNNANIGFRWTLTDQERGRVSRAFTYAVKSQAALYAASPLFNTGGSKYTWDKATEITKEALDACLANGFQLFNLTPAPDVAINSYDLYFINRSNPSRSIDKETIFETTSSRTNVWKWAGTPITTGVEKAGANPSQELVDAYGMQATGEMAILGYSDPEHLQPILNPTSGYDPSNPYEGRDPRFYSSIYYNNSPRSLSSGQVDKEILPITILEAPINNTTRVENGEETTISSIGDDPWIFTSNLNGKINEDAQERLVTFEYKSTSAISDGQFFYCVAGGPQGGVSSPANIEIPQASEWTRFEFDLSEAITDYGFGVNNSKGQEPENHFFRFDFAGGSGKDLTIRNFRIESFTPPPDAIPVETFVSGNSEISDRISETLNTRTGYYLRKFNNYKSGPNTDEDGFMKIYRLGELYLNFAEAAYQSVGPDAQVASKNGGSALSALDAVNKIRERAKMPPLPAGISKEDFQVRYRNERRVELAFEEHRFFDVRRWKILDKTDGFVTGMRITKTGSDFNYTRIKLQDRGTNADRYLLYPINELEVSKMETYTGENWQNPGW